MTGGRRRHAAPSSRYLTLVADGERLHARGGVTEPIDAPAQLVEAARKLAGGVECIVWVHPSAHARWGLPDRPGEHAAPFGALRVAAPSSGWLVDDAAPKVHVAFPGYGKELASAGDARELGAAVELWRRHVGLAYAFSGASTVEQLIGVLGAVPALDGDGEPEPEGYSPSAWTSGTANDWRGIDGLEQLEQAGRRWVRVFDRAGSFLSAWRGTNLAAGAWEHVPGGAIAEVGPESNKPAGYWLVDVDELPAAQALFDPFRRHGDEGGPCWLTTPLVQLAVELRGGPVPVREGWVALDRCRALDGAGERLAAAKAALEADPSPAAAVALATLKRAYSATTTRIGFTLQPPNPLARPSWCRTVRERFVANTYRSLAKAAPGPVALCDVDAVLFALAEPDEIPDGLRVDGALGSWKPKGLALEISQARDAYAQGGPHAVVQLAQGHDPAPVRVSATGRRRIPRVKATAGGR